MGEVQEAEGDMREEEGEAAAYMPGAVAAREAGRPESAAGVEADRPVAAAGVEVAGWCLLRLFGW